MGSVIASSVIQRLHMPELPEVETLRLGLKKYLVGHTIKDVEIKIAKMFSGNKNKAIGAKVVDIKRIGKGLIIELDNDYALAIHLKMTGQIIYQKANIKYQISKKVGGQLPNKFTHVIFHLDKGTFLYYNDLRQFGWIKVVKKDQIMQMPFFKEMGPEPLKNLTLEKFKALIVKLGLSIKVLLMDQKKIGGIGNIYANDALYKAGIDPRRKAQSLSDTEVNNLYKAIFAVLRAGLNYGGSSDENFVNALGQEGNYQNHTLIYGKQGQKCSRCGSIIQKIKLGGRGTYFCPACQVKPTVVF